MSLALFDEIYDLGNLLEVKVGRREYAGYEIFLVGIRPTGSV